MARCKVCGFEIAQKSQRCPSSGHSRRCEPEDAAPAPKESHVHVHNGKTANYSRELCSICPPEAGARVAVPGAAVCAWPFSGECPTKDECIAANMCLRNLSQYRPVAQSAAGWELNKLRARHMFQEDEWIEQKAREEDGANVTAGRAEPAAEQVGAEPFAKWILNSFDWQKFRFEMLATAGSSGQSAQTIAEAVGKWADKYAAHVTKGLEARLAESERMVRMCENAFKLQEAFKVEGRAGEFNGLQIAKAWLALEKRAEAAEARNVELMGERDDARQEVADLIKYAEMLEKDWKDRGTQLAEAQKASQCPVCSSHKLQCPDGHAWNIPTDIQPKEEK